MIQHAFHQADIITRDDKVGTMNSLFPHRLSWYPNELVLPG